MKREKSKLEKLFHKVHLKWFYALQQFLNPKDFMSAWVNTSSYFWYQKKKKKKNCVVWWCPYYGKIMKPSPTCSPFILDFFPCLWHKNTLILIYLFTSVLFPDFHCPCFLYWTAWTFFQVWHIWEKLTSSISLILSYLWVSVVVLRRNNVILFATRVILVKMCVASLF